MRMVAWCCSVVIRFIGLGRRLVIVCSFILFAATRIEKLFRNRYIWTY